MDRFPPAEDGPHYELTALSRTLSDLQPGDTFAPRPGGVLLPVIWTAVTTLALIAFMVWLLVS